jgi:hypothetical protein
MSDELDLERGDSVLADQIAEGKASRAARKPRAGSGSKGTTRKKTPAAEAAEEKTLAGRCTKAIEDLAEVVVHNDEELADVLVRRKEAMAQGLVGLTRTITILRYPLVFMVAFIEPVIGFWELGALFLGRAVSRRQRRQMEHDMENAGAPVVGENLWVGTDAG